MDPVGKPPVEPSLREFFASADGVCVYVNVRGRAIRVEFDSPEAVAVVRGATDKGTELAAALASAALAKYRQELLPLFDTVQRERFAR